MRDDLTKNQEKILDELIDDIETWRKNISHSGKLEKSELIQFVDWLQKDIINKTSFLPESGSNLILYSGKDSNGEDIWKEMKDFCEKNPDFYYISKTDAGTILWEKEFQDKIIETIGDRSIAERVLSGREWNSATGSVGGRLSQYAVDGTDLLAMDDFISYTLTKTAIDNGYSVSYVAGKGVSTADKKVGILTELPCVISENVGKIMLRSKATKFVAVDDLNKLLSSDLSKYSDVFIRNSNFLLDDEGIIRGVHLEMNVFRQ